MDDYGYITNLESIIDIKIDEDFMELLEDAGINSEPEVTSLKFSLYIYNRRKFVASNNCHLSAI